MTLPAAVEAGRIRITVSGMGSSSGDSIRLVVVKSRGADARELLLTILAITTPWDSYPRDTLGASAHKPAGAPLILEREAWRRTSISGLDNRRLILDDSRVRFFSRKVFLPSSLCQALGSLVHNSGVNWQVARGLPGQLKVRCAEFGHCDVPNLANDVPLYLYKSESVKGRIGILGHCL